MKTICTILITLLLLAIPVSAQTFTAPTAPESAQKYMPEEIDTFWNDVWEIIKSAVSDVRPQLTTAASTCVRVITLSMLIGIVNVITSGSKQIVTLIGTIAVGVILVSPAKAMVGLGLHTVQQISEYGKLLLPVLASALAAQGAVSASASLCTVATIVCAVLSTLVCRVLIPLVCIFLCISLVGCVAEDGFIPKIKKSCKGISVWLLKVILYLFTGFLTITGVVSGTVDASAMKAAKLTMSGVVPVVGSILSDATEAVLVSAALMKNAAGVYGLVAVIAIWIGPFLEIGLQYLIFKLTACVSVLFVPKETSTFLDDFSDAMGLVLAMTGAVCVIQLISIACFMRGVG